MARQVIEFTLVYAGVLSKTEIDEMTDEDVMRYLNQYRILKEMEVEATKR